MVDDLWLMLSVFVLVFELVDAVMVTAGGDYGPTPVLPSTPDDRFLVFVQRPPEFFEGGV